MNTAVALAYKIIFGALFLGIVFVCGMLTDRSYFNVYKGEVNGVAEAQGKIAKAADVKNQGDANVSLDQYYKDIQAVNDYYHAHPVVRMRVVNGACTVPEAPDNSKVPDGAASTLYASAYDPAEVERVAARLDELQKRLVEAGVTVAQ